MDEAVNAFCLALIALFLPPLSVFLISGCSPDFVINIFLTILCWFPGTIHAFYVIWVYNARRRPDPYLRAAPGIYSENIQGGGRPYGTI